jgi:flagellar export protein FliJ
MTKFVFKLTGLLKLREAERDARRMRMAAAAGVAASLRQELDRIDNELAELLNHCRRAAGPGPIDLGRLREGQRFEALLKSRRQTADRELQTADAEVERCRLDVVEANRDVRVLENLRTRQSERHLEKEHRQEVGQLDEAAGRSDASQ